MFTSILLRYLRHRLSHRTYANVCFELNSHRAHQGSLGLAPSRKLHLGAGTRQIAGWLNVDAVGGDLSLDFRQPLPFADKSFDVIVSQHVIEHLDIEHELPPLLHELFRVMADNAILWLSVPDLETVCKCYTNGEAGKLLSDIQSRHPSFGLNGLPESQVVNWLFHQGGEHKNLFDYAILQSLLLRAGFSQIERSDEKALLSDMPDFPPRKDDFLSLYVMAKK